MAEPPMHRSMLLNKALKPIPNVAHHAIRALAWAPALLWHADRVDHRADESDSCDCPALTTAANGNPVIVHAMWSFVVNPPRDRPRP